jgi:hypothetical protein
LDNFGSRATYLENFSHIRLLTIPYARPVPSLAAARGPFISVEIATLSDSFSPSAGSAGGPDDAPHAWRRPVTALASFVTSIALVALVAAAIRLSDLAGATLAALWRAWMATDTATLSASGAAVLTTAAVLGSMYVALRKLELIDMTLGLGIGCNSMPFLLAGLVFVALLASLADGITRAAGVIITRAPVDTLVLFGEVLVLPLAQELLLHGALMPCVGRKLGAVAAVVLTALAGLPAAAPVPEVAGLALGLQLFFGWMAWSCRSLGAAALMHATYIVIRLALAG